MMMAMDLVMECMIICRSDDNDLFIYPLQLKPDGKDNDCDGGIDEKTTTDDDGDSLSEFDGDCNDNDKDTYLVHQKT